MELVTENWSDRHLDDLSRRVDHGFALVDYRLDQRFEQLHLRFDKMEGRLDSFQETVVRGIIGAICGGLTMFAAVIGLIATQI